MFTQARRQMTLLGSCHLPQPPTNPIRTIDIIPLNIPSHRPRCPSSVPITRAAHRPLKATVSLQKSIGRGGRASRESGQRGDTSDYRRGTIAPKTGCLPPVGSASQAPAHHVRFFFSPKMRNDACSTRQTNQYK